MRLFYAFRVYLDALLILDELCVCFKQTHYSSQTNNASGAAKINTASVNISVVE